MPVFKCKMCGGDLQIGEKDTIAQCENCGTRQTLPRLDDDRRANLYDRANHFRRGSEFDKAEALYEQILTEDINDAEAYWSLVLCKYGVEYVEDPASRQRVPTCKRTQFTAVFADEDYKQAIANADEAAKALYEAEAKVIDDIQKRILAISSKEKPFDVFVCYKESDASGVRTPDSVLAQDLYYQLTQEGFKVFFSRITLEDKLGVEYEPYIFAALNSSKIMVVVGTKPEHFNAIWVKNEWSRYLALIKNGAKKMLIPAYKDMDPYNLPEEFSHLQAQDMSKLGFMQDLIRGIKKILTPDTPPPAAKATAPARPSVDTDALLKRAYICLEDGETKKADELLEQVLNVNPECAGAYVGKLMLGLNVRSEYDLANGTRPLTNYVTYNNAMRFADDALKQRLAGHNQKIVDRINQQLSEAYNKAVWLFESGDLDNAGQAFRELGDFKDCRLYITEKIPEARYQKAISLLNGGDYVAADAIFRTLQDYKDSGVYVKDKIPAVKYAFARNLRRRGEYDKARQIFNELGDYKDARKYQRKKDSRLPALLFWGIVFIFTLQLFLSYFGADGSTLFQRVQIADNNGSTQYIFETVIDLLKPVLLCVPVCILAVLLLDKQRLVRKGAVRSGFFALPFLWVLFTSACFIYLGVTGRYPDEGFTFFYGLLVLPIIFLVVLLPWCYIPLAIVKAIVKKLPASKKAYTPVTVKNAGFYIKIATTALMALVVVAALAVTAKDVRAFTENRPDIFKPVNLSGLVKPVFKKVESSTTLDSEGEDVYFPSQAVDGNPRTAWVEGKEGDGKGQWIKFSSSTTQTVKGINIVIGFNKTETLYYKNNRPSKIEVRFDDGSSETLALANVYNTNQQFRFKTDHQTTSVMVIIADVYHGTKYKSTCIGEISFF